MRSIADIESDLARKQRELEELKGTETEIYTRIVGYYRSVRNWNKGKREEYRHRTPFRTEDSPREQPELPLDLESPAASATSTPHTALASDAEWSSRSRRISGIVSCTYFFRKTCPTCKPVRQLISQYVGDVREVDVDSDEGLELAIEHEILATPTVLFADASGNVVFRSSDPQEIAGVIGAAV